jgi:hypothetical protein
MAGLAHCKARRRPTPIVLIPTTRWCRWPYGLSAHIHGHMKGSLWLGSIEIRSDVPFERLITIPERTSRLLGDGKMKVGGLGS